MQFGDYECLSLEIGRFKLDGGSMFGIVPKALWNKKTPADECNRINMAARSLLIRGQSRTILVDAGCGNKMNDKLTSIYGINTPTPDSVLAPEGLCCGDITDVILTHLHFDHAGGSTTIKNGRPVPTFPRATYHIQKTQWEHACRPGAHDTGSYITDDFLPLQEHGVINLIDGNSTLFDQIELITTNGHTPAQQHPLIKGVETSLFFCGDLFPTAAHLPAAWHMAYDVRPLEIVNEKNRIAARAADQNWLLFFEHDPDIAAAPITHANNNFSLGEPLRI
ncbi:MAG: MBL fold metallo-hydrolase [Deltaproteobacteria bacterium]|nr:MBL fold metallo-hydrolase [Deltaproteobacteria bacterium]